MLPIVTIDQQWNNASENNIEAWKDFFLFKIKITKIVFAIFTQNV